LFASPNDWNKEFQRSYKNVELNNNLSEIEAKIKEISDKLYFDNKSITSKMVVDLYKGKNIGNYSISDYFNYYLYQ